MTAIAPVINYSPTSGAGFGVAGNAAFYTGPPRTTKISSIVASAMFTTKKQLLLSAKVDTMGLENGWRVTGDGRFYNTSQDTFGLGTGTSEDDALNQKYNFFRVYEAIYLRLLRRPISGAGCSTTATSTSTPTTTCRGGLGQVAVRGVLAAPRVRPGQADIVGGVRPMRCSTAVTARSTPAEDGSRSSSYQMFFEGFLGGSSQWQQVSYDVAHATAV